MAFVFMLSLLAQASAPPPDQVDTTRRAWYDHQTFIAPSGEPFHAPAEAPYPSVQWFTEADTNHDGKLTSVEFTADFLRFFDRLDANRDGVIDSAELDAYEKVVAPEVHI